MVFIVKYENNNEDILLNLQGYKSNGEYIDCTHSNCPSQMEDVIFFRAVGSSITLNIESENTTIPEKEFTVEANQIYTEFTENDEKHEECINFNDLFSPITNFDNYFYYSVKKDFELKANEEICITGALYIFGQLGFIIEGQNIQMGTSKGGTKIRNAYFSSYETTYIVTNTTQKVNLSIIHTSFENEFSSYLIIGKVNQKLMMIIHTNFYIFIIQNHLK